MCSLRINVWHDHGMYLLRIHSQIKTFHPNLQPRDIFYPLTFSWPWLFYKHPDKIDTFSSKSYCSMKINTVEPLLSCYTVPFPLPASYWCPGRHQQITEETTWGQPLMNSHLSLSQGGCTVKCSELIWLPTQIKIFSFHIRSHCDCQKTKCMRICYNFASYKVVWIPDCEKLCLNPGPICLKVD